jgi:cytochrome c peroxidase
MNVWKWLPWMCLSSVATAGDLTLRIIPAVPAGELRLNGTPVKNTDGETWTVTRLSYLVSGAALRRVDGTWLELQDEPAWLNAATSRNLVPLKNIPAGDYAALRFHIGLTEDENQRDPSSRGPDHPLNPRLNGLHWSWQGGYIFLALEGMWKGRSDEMKGYSFHLGRQPFRTAVTIEGPWKISDQAMTAALEMDLARVLSDISFVRDGMTTHARDGDPLALLLQENLRRAFSFVSLVPDTRDTTQSPATAAPALISTALPGPGSGFPKPRLPPDNPLTPDRVELGRRLFHDTRLSRDQKLSCASCHQESSALSDPRRFSLGVEGRTGDRNSMPLFNLAWKDSFFWDGRAGSLRQQALMPIIDHREMDESVENVVMKLSKDDLMNSAFRKAFGSPEVTAERLGLAMEAFLLTLTSHDSLFDRAQRGEAKLSPDEQRGFELFMMEREPRLGTMGADCFHCHGGALFTDHGFRSNGLAIDERDTGRHRVTEAALDRGTFATPSLRNIALTAPYMHDGRFASLEEVLDHYSEGVQRTDTLDPNLAKHPDGGLHLTAEEKRCVIAFLKTLTDDRFARSSPSSR